MNIPKLTESIIRSNAESGIFSRGKDLFYNKAISNAEIQGSHLYGICEGTYHPFYKVRVELDEGGIKSAICSCPYGGCCKHIVALLLTYLHNPEEFKVRKPLEDLLSNLDRNELMALIVKLLEREPNLIDYIEAALNVRSNSNKDKNSQPKCRTIDFSLYRRQVHKVIHSLDHMRTSEAYRHVGGLVDELRDIEKSAIEFLNADDAETALKILLILIEEGLKGFDHIDDSDGELGAFLGDLGKSLAEVILTLDPDEDFREELITELEDLNNKLDDYGVDGLDVAMAAAKFGWGKLYEDEIYDDYDEDEDDYDGDYYDEEMEFDDYSHNSNYRGESLRENLNTAKLNVLERQGRTDEYLKMCLEVKAYLRYALKLTSLGKVDEALSSSIKYLTDTRDAYDLAKVLRESGHINEAIKIAEHGLKLEGYKFRLAEWLAPIEEAQGRTEQALDTWLIAFDESPSLSIWQTVKKMAGPKWNRLQPEMMDSLKNHYSKEPLVDILLFEQRLDEAIEVANKEFHPSSYDSSLVGKVVDAVIEYKPEWAIKISIKQAEALIEPTKSKLYPYAANWLRRAKAAYIKSGKTKEWQDYLDKLKIEYKRRPSLMGELNKL
jgi:uncharacterized Zn finger protein